MLSRPPALLISLRVKNASSRACPGPLGRHDTDCRTSRTGHDSSPVSHGSRGLMRSGGDRNGGGPRYRGSHSERIRAMRKWAIIAAILALAGVAAFSMRRRSPTTSWKEAGRPRQMPALPRGQPDPVPGPPSSTAWPCRIGLAGSPGDEGRVLPGPGRMSPHNEKVEGTDPGPGGHPSSAVCLRKSTVLSLLLACDDRHPRLGRSYEQQHEPADQRDGPHDGWDGNRSSPLGSNLERAEIERRLPGLIGYALVDEGHDARNEKDTGEYFL